MFYFIIIRVSAMLGAIYGDIIGSYYEIHSTKDYNFELNRNCTFTDDTVLSAAVCKAILANSENISFIDVKKRAFEYAVQYKSFYRKYPHAGYGSMFISWAKDNELGVQHSYGNGAAMRVVPIGYAYNTLKQVLVQTKASCYYTHNHSEAIAGAKAVSGSVFLARNGKDKEEIKKFCEKQLGIKLNASIEQLRKSYVFDSRTRYSVPPAIIAFLESTDYESAVRNAISLGGDADTMACIAGGIAEAYYQLIPEHINSFCNKKIDSAIKSVIKDFTHKFLVK